MAVLVKDVMIPNPVTLNQNGTMGDAVEIFGRQHIGSLPIVDDAGHLVAFVSDGDVIDYIVKNTNRINRENRVPFRSFDQIDCFSKYVDASVDHPIMNCATKRVITVLLDETVKQASRILNKRHLKVMPVLDGNQVVGVITRNDIIRGMFNAYLDNPDAPCVEEGQEDDF